MELKFETEATIKNFSELLDGEFNDYFKRFKETNSVQDYIRLDRASGGIFGGLVEFSKQMSDGSDTNLLELKLMNDRLNTIYNMSVEPEFKGLVISAMSLTTLIAMNICKFKKCEYNGGYVLREEDICEFYENGGYVMIDGLPKNIKSFGYNLDCDNSRILFDFEQ